MIDVVPADPGPLLTPGDVAKRLAVSRSMSYALIKAGKLRALHIGRLPRITEAALREFIAAAEAAR